MKRLSGPVVPCPVCWESEELLEYLVTRCTEHNLQEPRRHFQTSLIHDARGYCMMHQPMKTTASYDIDYVKACANTDLDAVHSISGLLGILTHDFYITFNRIR